MKDNYLSELNDEDLKLSNKALELLKGAAIIKFRYDSKKAEIFIELDNGRRLFINNINNKYDISIT